MAITADTITELETAVADTRAVVDELLREASDIPRRLEAAENEDRAEHKAAWDKAVADGVEPRKRPQPSYPRLAEVKRREERLPTLILQARHGFALAECDLYAAQSRAKKAEVADRITFLDERIKSLKVELKAAQDEKDSVSGAGEPEAKRYYEYKREVNRLSINLEQRGIKAERR